MAQCPCRSVSCTRCRRLLGGLNSRGLLSWGCHLLLLLCGNGSDGRVHRTGMGWFLLDGWLRLRLCLLLRLRIGLRLAGLLSSYSRARRRRRPIRYLLFGGFERGIHRDRGVGHGLSRILSIILHLGLGRLSVVLCLRLNL